MLQVTHQPSLTCTEDREAAVCYNSKTNVVLLMNKRRPLFAEYTDFSVNSPNKHEHEKFGIDKKHAIKKKKKKNHKRSDPSHAPASAHFNPQMTQSSLNAMCIICYAQICR